MKKQLLFLLLLAMFCQASAQRYADLSVTKLSPDDGDTIIINQQFLIAARIHNLGPDTLRATDSLQMTLKFDTGYIMFMVDTSFVPYLPIPAQEIAPGDSADVNFNFALFDGWEEGISNFCIGFTPFNGADMITDTITTNNEDCGNVDVMEDPAGIDEAVRHLHTVVIYPNPANDAANFSITLNNATDIKVQVLDMTGRVLLEETKPRANTGAYTIVVNTSGLAAGVYLYRITAGEEIQAGRLQIK